MQVALWQNAPADEVRRLSLSFDAFTCVCVVVLLLHVYQQGYNSPQRNFVPITSYQNEVNNDGSYQFNYLSGDGSQQQARGYLKNLGQKDLEAQVVQGSYSYTSPDGTPITVTYIADENGTVFFVVVVVVRQNHIINKQ